MSTRRPPVVPVGDGREALPLALTVAEAAQIMRVSVRTVYRGIEAGTVPTVRLTPGGKVFVPRVRLERLLGLGEQSS